MEVCKGESTPSESDMGVLDTDAILTVHGVGRNRHITMEGSQHISIRDAKVRAPEWRYLAALPNEATNY